MGVLVINAPIEMAAEVIFDVWAIFNVNQ